MFYEEIEKYYMGTPYMYYLEQYSPLTKKQKQNKKKKKKKR